MALERTLYCDGPDCERNVTTASPPPYIPGGFYMVRTEAPGMRPARYHFCGWDCILRYAGQQEPEQISGGGPDV